MTVLMDPAVISALYHERKVAYATTTADFRIDQVHDPWHLMGAVNEGWIGRTLSDLAPEVVGAEVVLDELVTGQRGWLDLDMVNRDDEDGKQCYFKLWLMPRPLPDGEGVGLIYMIEDMTELGEVQQRLMQSRNELLLARYELDNKNLELTAANLELRKLADMKTSFVSVAAHELRTPLSIIRGYTDMLLDGVLGQLEDAQREGLEILRHSSERLLEIVNNLLDVTRLEAGRIELMLQPLDLDGIIHTAAKEFRPVIEAAHQTLVVHVEPDLPPALCDETRTYQILTNLLSNATKYTPPGGRIELSARLGENGDEIVASVRDTGVGIPQADQERLGSLFFRASNANSVTARGAGLGLYITSSLVQLHGGRLWFDSVEGQGSTFYVSFLLADAPGQ